MSLFQVVVTLTSALAGGFMGGWVVAFRLGRWRQHVQDRLGSIERRLAEGDRFVDMVPVINARIEMMLEELREIKRALGEARTQFVTHEECDRTHAPGGRA